MVKSNVSNALPLLQQDQAVRPCAMAIFNVLAQEVKARDIDRMALGEIIRQEKVSKMVLGLW